MVLDRDMNTAERRLYHYTIGLPAKYRHPMATVRVEWTKHAERAAVTDRYGIVPIVTEVDLSRFFTVEVEQDERGVITKILVRGEFDSGHDVVYALVPRAGKPWVVKTTWLNAHTDVHRLGKSAWKYTKP